jgi:hypothetical protein
MPRCCTGWVRGSGFGVQKVTKAPRGVFFRGERGGPVRRGPMFFASKVGICPAATVPPALTGQRTPDYRAAQSKPVQRDGCSHGGLRIRRQRGETALAPTRRRNGGDRRCRGGRGRLAKERTAGRRGHGKRAGAEAPSTGKTSQETRPTDRRVVQSGPTRCSWPSRDRLRVPNTLAWPITERTDNRQSPLHGGPALAFSLLPTFPPVVRVAAMRTVEESSALDHPTRRRVLRSGPTRGGCRRPTPAARNRIGLPDQNPSAAAP